MSLGTTQAGRSTTQAQVSNGSHIQSGSSELLPRRCTGWDPFRPGLGRETRFEWVLCEAMVFEEKILTGPLFLPPSTHLSIQPSLLLSNQTSTHISIHQSIYPLIHSPIRPPTHPSTHPPIHSFTYPPIIHSSLHPSTHAFTCSPIHPHLSTHPCIHPSSHSFTIPPTHLPIHLPNHPSYSTIQPPFIHP